MRESASKVLALDMEVYWVVLLGIMTKNLYNQGKEASNARTKQQEVDKACSRVRVEEVLVSIYYRMMAREMVIVSSSLHLIIIST